MADNEKDFQFVVVEHRREIIGGTKHREYGVYETREDALDAMRELPWEFGVDFTVEKRKRK